MIALNYDSMSYPGPLISRNIFTDNGVSVLLGPRNTLDIFNSSSFAGGYSFVITEPNWFSGNTFTNSDVHMYLVNGGVWAPITKNNFMSQVSTKKKKKGEITLTLIF